MENRISCLAQDFHFHHLAYPRLGCSHKQTHRHSHSERLPFPAGKRRAEIPAARQMRHHRRACPRDVPPATQALRSGNERKPPTRYRLRERNRNPRIGIYCTPAQQGCGKVSE